MSFIPAFLLSALGLFGGMLLVMEIGRRAGIRRRAKDPKGADAGTAPVEGAIFGLMGLLIAFTFSGAGSRFEERRRLIVQETNAIGTAYLRLDVLPDAAQPALRQKFRQYVDARLAVYQKLPDLAAAKLEMRRAAALQGEIWKQAVAACRQSDSPGVMMVVLSALNEMIDITTTRAVALKTHPPPMIAVMFAVLVFACSLLAGYALAGSKTRNWLHTLGFTVILTVTVYVILDYEFPRIGMIRIDPMDQALTELRESFN